MGSLGRIGREGHPGAGQDHSGHGQAQNQEDHLPAALDSQPGLAGLQPTFTDGASIPTWAWGSVNVAVGTINHRPGRCRHELEQTPGADIAIPVGPDGKAVNFSATQFDSMFGDPTPHFFVVLDVLPEDPTYDAANPGHVDGGHIH